MKNVLLFFVLLFLGIQLDAQEKPFKNFYVQQGQYDVLFILPLDFEQKFEILKEEFLTHDCHRLRDSLQLTDSLKYWFGEHIYLGDIPCDEIIPDSFKQKLREYESKIKGGASAYFFVDALVNSDGKILSVYFRINGYILDLLQEEDLQAIYDSIICLEFNANEIEFSRVNHTLVKKYISITRDSDMNELERLALYKRMVKKEKMPCRYGVVTCFSMNIFN